MNSADAARTRQFSDETLAAHLRQIEVLFDLHSAGMNAQAARALLRRIRGVRETLEHRAEREAAARERIALIRRRGAKT